MYLSASVGVGGANRSADVKALQVLLDLNLPRLAGAVAIDVDGVWGSDTRGLLERFQHDVMGAALPSLRVDPDSATLTELHNGIAPGYTPVKLQGIALHASRQSVTTFGDVLATAMESRQINTPLRRAHFLAQIAHESGDLQFTEELASGDAYEGRADLGNVQPGDGRRFKGRGLIQLTGRANYAAYGQAIGRDLVHGDAARLLATDPAMAVDVACWFWERHGVNALADTDDARAITKRINGGLNGFDERVARLGRAKFLST